MAIVQEPISDSGAVDADRLLAVVRATLADLHGPGGAPRSVSLASSLDRDLELDSLARVELFARIEQAFGVQLPEVLLGSAETCADLLEALQVARPRAPVPPPARERLGTPSGRDATIAPTDARTLLDVLAWHTDRHPDLAPIRFDDDAAGAAMTYRDLWRGARAVAGGLQDRRLSPGQTVALMLPTGADYFHAFLGILIAGGIPVPIYPPTRRAQIEEHVRRHARILDNAGATTLITVDEIRGLARLLRMQVPALRRIETVASLSEPQAEPHPVEADPDSVAFLQYTSGSTGQPKGVILTHQNLLANLRALGSALQVNDTDVFVSWLPLYHDMGLIGAWLGTFYYGRPLVVMSPARFLARPVRWLQAIHRHGGTLSAAPNFAYELCLKRITDEELAGLDLGTWRAAMNGAEAVAPATLERFRRRFEPCGLRPTAIMPVYGLAECSVGLTLPPLGRGPRIDRIERSPFVRAGTAKPAAPDDPAPLRFVGCGVPLPGHEIRVVDEGGRELPERTEGRLEFKGPSATRGYHRNPTATARLIRDGWLDTGDRGYVAGGELFVTGRVKDIVIRAGRHVYPDEIEAAVGEIDGVRKGCVAVFGSPDPAGGTERLVGLAETHLDATAARDALRERIVQRVVGVLGEPPDEVALAPPHTVLKTSSGKIRRAASRENYERSRFGGRPRPVWAQLLRLGLGSIAPGLSRARRRIAESSYAAVFWGLFTLIVGFAWTVATIAPGSAFAWRICASATRRFLSLARLPFVIHGAANLPRDHAAVIVANHASYLDGVLLIAALPPRTIFVAKREFERNGITRTYLRGIGAEFVERFDVVASKSDVVRLIKKARTGRSLMLFPEGTFTRAPGLMPFHLGAFMIAAESGCPVVPIAIRGARSLLRDGQWLPRRGPVVLEIGEPIAIPPGTTPGDAFAAAVSLRDRAREHIRRYAGEPDLAAR